MLTLFGIIVLGSLWGAQHEFQNIPDMVFKMDLKSYLNIPRKVSHPILLHHIPSSCIALHRLVSYHGPGESAQRKFPQPS